MSILFREATLVYPGHKLHGTTQDILVERGKISKISKHIEAAKAQVVASGNLHVSIGWMDFRTHLGEPGYEERETIATGCRAAALGGFTALACSPETTPTTDNRATIEYVIKQSQDHLVDVYPFGAISKGLNGQDLAEMYDMQQAGAVAFSDGKRGLQNPKFMQLALEYASGIDALVLSFPMNEALKGKAEVNEGSNSTLLGLKGIPHLAEEIMVNRDLYLTEYTGGKIHFEAISSAASASLIKKSKQKGLPVSCDVSALQLVLNDGTLSEFDSNYKLMPPLRTEEDRKGLLKQVLDGTIDIICSDHTPHNIENKACEFELASYGAIHTQTAYASLNTALKGKLGADVIVEKMAINPRKVLGIEIPEIEEGASANLTAFDPDVEWEYNSDNNASRSSNSPFMGQTFKGKVLAVVNGSKSLIQ